MFHLLTQDREFADHNKAILQQWLSAWVPRVITASRTLQPIWIFPARRHDGGQSRLSGTPAAAVTGCVGEREAGKAEVV